MSGFSTSNISDHDLKAECTRRGWTVIDHRYHDVDKYYDDKCGVCGGSGTVTVPQYKTFFEMLNSSRVMRCPACDGKRTRIPRNMTKLDDFPSPPPGDVVQPPV